MNGSLKHILITFFFLLFCVSAWAQSATDWLNKGDELRYVYDFEGALEAYKNARSAASDTLLKVRSDDAIMMAQNGLGMMGYCSRPEVVARQKFSIEDFYLHYPLEDESWRPLPNALDSLPSGALVPAMYIPSGSSDVFFSAKDGEGIRNLYETILNDGIWSAPSLLGEQLTSASDDILPMLSPDGQTLYFASEGLYGMGGYDLYVSTWDSKRKEWSVPENMGFPYSSPYDDFLYANSSDGKYAVFASNRDCSKDSVWVYVLEHDSMPVRASIYDSEELLKLCKLEPAWEEYSSHSTPTSEDSEMAEYTNKMFQVRTLRDSIYSCSESIDSARDKYSATKDKNEKDALSRSIMQNELVLSELQDSLATVTKELQAIEMEFLLNGIVIDPEAVERSMDKRSAASSGITSFTFPLNSMGEPLTMTVEKPEPVFDYSFMILPEGRFAENNNLPSGVIYQIQIFAQSVPATVADLKGLSPVFERVTPKKIYAYSVGLFRTYKDALGNLNKVKARGFKTAFIAAYLDGKSISVQSARAMETQVTHLYQVKIYPDSGESLTENQLSAIHSVSAKDLSKVASGGVVYYILGPFNGKEEASAVVSSLKSSGLSRVEIEETD